MEINGEWAQVTVNPQIYSLEVIYSSAYVFLDRAYIILDGDPKKEIIVKLKLKYGGNLETLGYEFYNELIHYSDYTQRAQKTRTLRETMLQRSLLTNDPELLPANIRKKPTTEPRGKCNNPSQDD